MPWGADKNKKRKTKIEYSAGGVVFRRTPHGPQVAFVLDPYRKWGFAKGKIEKGETPEQAALRETTEEMGLRELRLVSPLGVVEIWFQERYRNRRPVPRPWTLIHKFIYYFLMEVPRTSRARPQHEELIHAVRWVAPDNAPRVLSYKNARPVLERALQIIRKKGRRK